MPFYAVHLFMLFYHVFVSLFLFLGKHSIEKHNTPSLAELARSQE